MCKTSLFNLQKSCLSASKPERKMLNGLIKLVFAPDELVTSKATDWIKENAVLLEVCILFHVLCTLVQYEKYVGKR